jgi:RimJ/RimL family protein N-acetyltransferase
LSGLPPIPTPHHLVIRTARLDLLPITRGHGEAMFKLLADPSLYEFITGSPPTDVETLSRQYEYWEKRSSPDGSELWLNWVMNFREEDELIGHLQAGVAADHADLAWVIGLRWQRQGYATEAATALVEWLIEELGVREIRASIHPAHAASIKVAERLGKRTDEYSGPELIWKLSAE